MFEPTAAPATSREQTTAATSGTARAGREHGRAAPEPGAAGLCARSPVPDRADGHRNEVFVVGRVTAAPSERELPSGDRLVTWRICVARPEVSGRRRGRADSLTLVSFDPRLRAAVEGWRVGDVVRVTGELRRRAWRGRGGVRSVLEVEADTAERLREAGR